MSRWTRLSLSVKDAGPALALAPRKYNYLCKRKCASLGHLLLLLEWSVLPRGPA